MAREISAVLASAILTYTVAYGQFVFTDQSTTQPETVTDPLYYEHSGILTREALTEMRSATITLGHIIIDGAGDFTEKELHDVLEEIFYVIGSLTIKNTTLKNIMSYWFVSPESYGDTILIMEDNLFLEGFNAHVVANILGAQASILNCPNLKPTKICPYLFGTFHQRYFVREQPHLCGCKLLHQTTMESISDLPDNCTTLIGNLTVTQDDHPSYDLLKEKLFSVREIVGIFSAINTQYTDLGFLESLEKVVCEYPSDRIHPCVIEIKDNLLLRAPKWYNLVSFDEGAVVIENNPLICLQMSEQRAALRAVYGAKLRVTLCTDEILPNTFHRLVNNSLEGLNSNHTAIIGDLVIDENSDLRNFRRLSNISMIYGSLTIRNTALRTNNWLYNLREILPMNDRKPALLIESNPKLEIVELFLSNLGRSQAVIRENKRLRVLKETCENLKSIGNYVTENNLKNCLEGEREESESSASIFLLPKLVLVILLALLA